MGNGKAINQPAQQGKRRRNQSAGCQNQAHKKEVFAHESSLTERSQGRPNSNSDWRLFRLIGGSCFRASLFAAGRKAAGLGPERPCAARLPDLSAPARCVKSAKNCV